MKKVTEYHIESWRSTKKWEHLIIMGRIVEDAFYKNSEYSYNKYKEQCEWMRIMPVSWLFWNEHVNGHKPEKV